MILNIETCFLVIVHGIHDQLNDIYPKAATFTMCFTLSQSPAGGGGKASDLMHASMLIIVESSVWNSH